MQTMLFCRIESVFDIRSVQNARQISEAWWQGHRFNPAQQFFLLQVKIGVRIFIYRSHVVKMSVRNDNVRHFVRSDIQLLKQPYGRDPFRYTELLSHYQAGILSHKTGIDKSNAIAAPSDH